MTNQNKKSPIPRLASAPMVPMSGSASKVQAALQDVAQRGKSLSRSIEETLAARDLSECLRWIQWDGFCGCPVESNLTVELLRRNGTCDEGAAWTFNWRHESHVAAGYDIIAYRVSMNQTETSQAEFMAYCARMGWKIEGTLIVKPSSSGPTDLSVISAPASLAIAKKVAPAKSNQRSKKTPDYTRCGLVLSRKVKERIMIGDKIILTVIEIRGDKVRIAIDAPQDMPVHREEVYNAIMRQGSSAFTPGQSLSNPTSDALKGNTDGTQETTSQL